MQWIADGWESGGPLAGTPPRSDLAEDGRPMKPGTSLTALGIAVVAVGLCVGAADTPDGQRWWSHVAFLADDALEGRDTGSPGHRKAAEYVAKEFEKLGLRPAGTAGYLQ